MNWSSELEKKVNPRHYDGKIRSFIKAKLVLATFVFDTVVVVLYRLVSKHK